MVSAHISAHNWFGSVEITGTPTTSAISQQGLYRIQIDRCADLEANGMSRVMWDLKVKIVCKMKVARKETKAVKVTIWMF